MAKSVMVHLLNHAAALAEQLQSDVPQIGGRGRRGRFFAIRSVAWPWRSSGSTSACALSVSISTARLDCTIFWSADAWARLMSEETSLYAVLIAASADSTSGGGSIPVISDASSVIPYRASDEAHSLAM